MTHAMSVKPPAPGRYFISHSDGQPLAYPYYWWDGEHWSSPESDPLPEPTGEQREMGLPMHPEWLWTEAPRVH